MSLGPTRRFAALVQIVLTSVIVLFACDWGWFHLRLSCGTAYGSVQVEQYLATPLKGSKAEYDYLGTAPQSCSRTLFPQGGNVPCWWLERHKQQWL